MKIERNTGSKGSSAARDSAIEWAPVVAPSTSPATDIGHRTRRAGPVAATSRQTQNAARAPAAAMTNQTSMTWIV